MTEALTVPSVGIHVARGRGYGTRSMPKVTVIVPTYNRPERLLVTLASVAAQTARPAKVVVVDDCSDVPVSRAALQARFRNLRIVVKRHAQNRGPGPAVATGMAEVATPLVAFLNDDDTWRPRFLELLTIALVGAGVDCAFCDHGVIDENGKADESAADALSRLYGRDRLGRGPVQSLARSAVIDQSVASQGFLLVKSESVDVGLIGEATAHWDFFVGVGLALKGATGTFVSERLGDYRLSSDSITSGFRDPRARAVAIGASLRGYRLVCMAPQCRTIWWASLKKLAWNLALGIRCATRARAIGAIGPLLIGVASNRVIPRHLC